MSKENELREYRSPSFGDLVPSPIDWARLAAFIDGEGSILINTQRPANENRNPGWYLRVSVTNTDIRLMIWLKDTFGGTFKDANTDKYYEGKNWKRVYHWGASSTRGAWLLYNCMSYFVLKAEQAELGLQLQDSLQTTRNNKRAGIPSNVVEFRREVKQKLSRLKERGRSKEEKKEGEGGCIEKITA